MPELEEVWANENGEAGVRIPATKCSYQRVVTWRGHRPSVLIRALASLQLRR